MHDPLPRGLLQIGVIVDDLVALERCLRSDLDAIQVGALATAADERMERAVMGYAACGLERNPKKGFRNEYLAKFWGVEIDGLKGVFRGSSSRLWPTMLISLRVACLGLATMNLLETLAGSWIALLLPRRRMFCILDCIYGALAHSAPNTIIRLSQAMKDELVCLACLAPLAVMDMRAPHHHALVATDASLKCLAAVEAKVPEPLCSELCRTAISRGRWANLLSPVAAWERQHDLLDPTEEIEDPYAVHPFWELCARSLVYEELWRKRVDRPRHINILEARAHLAEEQRVAIRFGRRRVPFALDSQVCLGSFSKGRSSSPALNRCMKRSLGYALGGGVFSSYLYFPSKTNRADGPTRDSQPEAPDMIAPPWLLATAEQFFFGLDSWLKSIGASFSCKLPFASLGRFDDVDIAPSSAIRVHHAVAAEQEHKMPERRTGEVEAPTLSDDTQRSPDSGISNVDSRTISDGTDDAFERLHKRFPAKQFFFAHGVERPCVPGALDLYSGNYGVARQLVKNGCPWVLTFDIKRSKDEDLLDPGLQEEILEFIRLGVFLALGLAPICCSFSRAITPAVRSRRWPRGIPGVTGAMFQKLKQGNIHAAFCLQVMSLALLLDIAFWCENPDKSFIWLQRGWEAWRDPHSSDVFRLAYCRFGTAWQKMTRVATNTLLAGLRMPCLCKKPHIALRGYSRLHRKSWTAVAEPYPRGFAKLLALGLCVKAGWCSSSKLSISGCARAASLRIGEASNPGPGKFVARPSLHELPTLTTHTMALEARLLQHFIDWCRLEIRICSCEVIFDACPETLVYLLKVFGDLMFQQRRGLSNFRHLLLASQRWKPRVRPLMQPAWDLISRWEQQEPVQHRIPIPEPLVRAMIVLAWLHGWYSWCCATAVAFYGGGRLGEILKCCRSDLLLPVDFLDSGTAPVFLKLSHFKSKNRQPAKVQHLRVTEETTCSLLHRVFCRVHPEGLLFGGSAYQYRKRWNAILNTLRIPQGVRLTPGGLRGGFAVWSYRTNCSIQNIMWSLRLRSQVTLESYLQEAAALNCFAGLSMEVREEINTLSAFFPCLPAASL